LSRKSKILILVVVVLGFGVAAYFLFKGNSFVLSNTKKEGIITYKLEYLEENDITTLLPTEMTITFKNDNMHQKVVGWSNIFSLEGIRNMKEQSCSALFKVLGKRYVYTKKELGQVVFGYDPYKGMKLVKTNETKKIAGFDCKKVKIEFPDNSHDNFDIYYTNEIKINTPNWNNPFYQIDGVLMEYQIDMFGIKTKIVADTVQFIKVDDSEFDVPVDYKQVSKEELEEEINKLL
jgi:hypothetical protein